RLHNVEGPAFTRQTAGDVEAAIASGSVVVGSPDTVRKNLAGQIKTLGINNLIVAPYFGNISHENAMRSLTMFAEEVIPALEDL
ncbi:MAG: hypothetical protein O3A84_16770, partial [Proteobacteria bacterium]|nr:hypothetical protein [Pseudomonadota bacterium]